MNKKKIVSIIGAVACAAAVMFSAGCASNYTVTVNNVGNNESRTLSLGAGQTVTMSKLAEEYPEMLKSDTGFFMDKHFYTDETCRSKYVGDVDGDVTLYFGMYSPMEFGEVVFDYDGEQYVVYRAIGSALAASDFTRSAYGYGGESDYAFYSDAERSTPVDLAAVEVISMLSNDEERVTVYVAKA